MRNFEREICTRVEQAGRAYCEGQGVVEQQANQIYELTNIVAHLTQVLVDIGVLNDPELNNL